MVDCSVRQTGLRNAFNSIFEVYGETIDTLLTQYLPRISYRIVKNLSDFKINNLYIGILKLHVISIIHVKFFALNELIYQLENKERH